MSSQPGSNRTLHNHKRFVFRSNLNKLLADAKTFPPSPNPCSKCSQKKKPCICSAINSGVGRTPRYEIAELSETKSMLNDLRDALNDVDMEKWSSHTKLLDNTSLVTKHLSELKLNYNGRNEPGVELVTNAWLKLYEILEVYGLVEHLKPNFKTEGGTLTSFHLSECPGAFIAALNHNLKSKNCRFGRNSDAGELKWLATSLNPYYEGNDPNVVLAEDILFRETHQNWILGCDNSGNIARSANIEYIWDHVSRPSRYNKSKTPLLVRGPTSQVDLVTADGSFNCQFDPNNQELLTAPLKFAEVVCALGLLRVGGCFVLKMFTLFEECSLSIFTLLALCFKKVEVYKPFLSKESNAEVYVVCLDFTGITSILLSSLCKFVDGYAGQAAAAPGARSILPKEWVPRPFRTEFVDCAKMFTEIQCRNLRNSLALYKTSFNENPYYKEKREFAQAFLRHFKLAPISPESRLVKRTQFGDSLISGKDTSSLGHVPKQYFSKFQDRVQHHETYLGLQKARAERRRTGNTRLRLSDCDNTASFAQSVAETARLVTRTRGRAQGPGPEQRLELALKLDADVLESLLDDLKHQRYLRENWFSVGSIEPEHAKFSFFCSNDLLFELTHARTHCEAALPVTTVQECLLSAASAGEALTDLNSFPSATALHLALVLREHLNLRRYRFYLEVTSNDGQEFPAISLLKRHNVPGALVYDHGARDAPRAENGPAAAGSRALFVYDNIFELQTMLNNFPGDGNVDHCFEYDYASLLAGNQSYKSLIGELLDSSLRRNCDFIFCDLYGGEALREPLGRELAAKPALVVQLVQSLNCLADAGDLVIRLFPALTRFTVGALCCLATVFEDVVLCRPESVAGWSQEVYVVCKNYRDRENAACRHFFQCLWDALALHHQSRQTLLQVVKPAHFTAAAK